MAAEHAELINEMAALEKMSVSERLKLARKRRAQQLKICSQHEKQLLKETANSKKSKKIQLTAGSKSVNGSKSRNRLRFNQSVLLLDAVGRNDLDEVKDLLNKSVDPNLCNEDGLTALHQCSIDDSEEILKLLVQFGANVNARDSELWTPLHAAATCGYLRISQYLCEHGAEVLAVNADGNMPYDLCEDAATLDYIESEMAKQGITQEMIDDIRLSAENKMLVDMKQLNNNGGDLEFRGRNGETPLHIAACNGFIHVTEFLLAQNVSVNVCDDDDWQPIHCSACWGQLQVLELLLEHGADFHARTKNGEFPLDLCEDIEIKQKIIEISEEIQTKQPHKPRESGSKRRNSTQRRGSSVNLALRRTSVHEKSSIAHKEAYMEAQRLQESIETLQNDEDDDDEIVIDAVTTKPVEVNDINTSLSSTKTDKSKLKEQTMNQKPLKSILVSNNPNKNNSATSKPPGNKIEKKTTESVEAKKDALPPEQSRNVTPAKNDKPSTKKTTSKETIQTAEINRVAKELSSSTDDVPPTAATSSQSPASSLSQPPPSGSLADLKKQREAKRQIAIDNQNSINKLAMANGGDKNGNKSNMTIDDIYGTKSSHRTVGSSEEAMNNEDKSCCCLVM